VREGAVVARADARGEMQLVAYVVEGSGVRDQGSRDASVEHLTPDPRSLIPELRAFLRARLPVYMVPAAFVLLDVLPRTPNGKIDRNALPAPADHATDADETYVAPRTPIESVLTTMWHEALQTTRVGIHDNFFDLGGHSLSATRIISRVRQAFQITLTARQLFETPTVAGLAEHMITTERQPGLTDAIARALQRLQRMSANDRQQILQQKKSSEDM
jgi:acyl carrier protein